MLEELLNTEGLKAVELYRESFIKGDRVATGATNKSVAFEIKKEGGSVTLSVYGRKDISDLEEGVSAEQYSSNPASFSDLDQWINARGLHHRTPFSIDRGLKLSGWSQNGKNRTNPNGGTKDIITTPTNQIIESITQKVTDISKELVVKQIDITI